MDSGVSMPRSFKIPAIFSPTFPAWLMPVRSPLTSAINTGTPIFEKFSASVCSVTVLPVPVAPVIKPCRLASAGSSAQVVFAFFAINRGSAMEVSCAEKVKWSEEIINSQGFFVAGHSKWANIQHRKGRQDEKRQRVWTRVMREIMVAARMGGGDVATNPRLRLAIEKGKAANMPSENVKYGIAKATGSLEGVHYEEVRYEGYGIGGAAIIVDCMTDNKVRTVAEVRHAFAKFGGHMGTEGSVAFQFKHCGQLIFAPGTPEDKLMEVALDAGADDVITHDDGAIEVLTPYAQFEVIKHALEAAGLKAELAEVTMRADNMIELSAGEAATMQKLLDLLEDLDDTQDVFHNAAMSD